MNHFSAMGAIRSVLVSMVAIGILGLDFGSGIRLGGLGAVKTLYSSTALYPGPLFLEVMLMDGTVGSAPSSFIGPCAPTSIDVPNSAMTDTEYINIDTAKLEVTEIKLFIEPSFYEGVIESCPNGKETDATPIFTLTPSAI